MPCPPSTDEFVHFTVSVRRSDLATILGVTPPPSPEVYITGGPTPRLPDGYTRRTLDDACRRGELRGTPVPRSGWRVTAADLAAWAASRSRRRRRTDTKPIGNVVESQVLADRRLLAQAGGAARRSA